MLPPAFPFAFFNFHFSICLSFFLLSCFRDSSSCFLPDRQPASQSVVHDVVAQAFAGQADGHFQGVGAVVVVGGGELLELLDQEAGAGGFALESQAMRGHVGA